MAVIPDFVGESNFSRNIVGIIKSVSKSKASVLLEGERGTGKRLYAQKVHCESACGLKTFFELNCRILKDIEIHYILEKILNTDFTENRCTVFVNNIEYLSLPMQIEFLDFTKKLQAKTENAKIISSCCKSLDEMKKKELFNTDLYFQLSVVKLNFPPLRQRQEDIIPIANYYFEKFKKDSGFFFTQFSEKAIAALKQKPWYGNCDELINAIQRGFIVGKKPEISDIDMAISNNSSEQLQVNDSEDDKTLKTAMDSFKKAYITKILKENNWNQTKTAKILGIQRTYVIKLINELDIRF